MRGKSCLVCGKEEDETAVKRRVDTEAHWYLEILKQVLGDEHEEFQSFCNICDRLVSEFEDVSKEKKSIQLELEFRISNQDSNYDNYEYEDDDNHEMVINDEVDSDGDIEESEKEEFEKGEIPDVSSFIKNEGVKIFEIDVKQQESPPQPPVKRKEVVITKFEKPNIQKELSDSPPADSEVKRKAVDPLPVEERKVEVGNRRLTFTECQDNLICFFCLRQFSDQFSFSQHKLIHSDEKDQENYKCDRCQKDFLSEVRLNIHMKHCNFGEILQCDICNKNFANKRNLKDHVNIFHNKDSLKSDSKYHFPCPQCDKVFYKKSNLTSHLIRHSDVFPFVCDAPGCGKGFKREKTLVKHYQVIHEGRKEEFLCGHCGQQFLSQTGLKSHVALHNGQEYVRRNFKCDVCGKSFRSQWDLNTHLVVHTKEKPFLCKWPKCGQSFSQKASLKDHMNVHEKKFQCEGCKKSFGRERYLMLHLKTCAHIGKRAESVDCIEENINVQHIIITTEQEMLGTDITNDVEMTHMQVVQSETGELAVTMIVDTDNVDTGAGVLQVVTDH